MNWPDRIYGLEESGGKRKDVEFNLYELSNFLNTDPIGIQHSRNKLLLSLLALGAKYKKIAVLPAGTIIRYMGLYVIQTIVTGGTSAHMALGQHDGDVDAYGKTNGLLQQANFSKLFNGQPLGSNVDLDLNVVTSDGSALGSVDITGGSVLISFTLEVPCQMV